MICLCVLCMVVRLVGVVEGLVLSLELEVDLMVVICLGMVGEVLVFLLLLFGMGWWMIDFGVFGLDFLNLFFFYLVLLYLGLVRDCLSCSFGVRGFFLGCGRGLGCEVFFGLGIVFFFLGLGNKEVFNFLDRWFFLGVLGSVFLVF